MKTIVRRISAITAAFVFTLMMSIAFALPAFAETPEEQAERILAGMSTKQKIAQMMKIKRGIIKRTGDTN